MTSVMLATYPDVFAGGAIIAGLPFGSATSLSQAFNRMQGHGGPSDQELVALVRNASSNVTPWPTISVWHGSDDRTVDPSMPMQLLDNGSRFTMLRESPTRVDLVDGYPRRVWCNSRGREVVEGIQNCEHGAWRAPKVWRL